MKTLFLRLLGVLFLVMYTPGIYAVDDDRTITSSIQNSKETTVIVNDVMYMLPEEEPSLSFSFTDTAAIYSIEAANFILTDVTGNTHHSSFRNRTINNNTVVFGEHTFIVPDVGIDYTAKVIIQYTLRSGKNRMLVYDIPMTFHKCNTPQIENVTSINGTYYAGTPIDLVMTNIGGNSNGWRFLWPTGLSNSPTYSFETTSDGNIIKDESFTVTVYNYAPDNETVWLSQDFNFEIYTYSKPNLELLANDKLILVDGDEQTLGINVDGGNPSTWTYEWYLNNERIEHSDAKLSLIAENKSIHDITMYYQLVAKNSLVNSTTFSKTFNFEVCVKPMPKAELATANDIVLLHDQQYTFALATTGGDKEWEFEWFIDNKKIDSVSINKFIVTAQNTTNSVLYNTYKVTARNEVNKRLFEYNYQFELETWPAVTEGYSSTEQNCYYGDEVILSANLTGGFKDGWSYIWNGDIQATNDSYSYVVPFSSSSSTNKKVTLKVINDHEKAPYRPLYEKEIQFEIIGWSHGSIKALTYDNVKKCYRSGDDIVISTEVEGGYPNWTFEWYYNNSLIQTTSTPEYTFEAYTNFGNEFVVDKIKLIAVNSIPETNKSKSSETEIDFEIYPEAIFPEDFMLSAIECLDEKEYSIREGNNLTLSVELATGGYYVDNDTHWQYTWYENIDNNYSVLKSSNLPDKSSLDLGIVSSPVTGVKHIEKKRYSLEILNKGPYETNWYERFYDTKNLKIYTRPSSPDKLQIKGNGSSNVLICTMALSDQLLKERKYEFVFGYTDEDGVDHEMLPTSNRWCQIDNKVSVKDSRYRFWVYSLWVYDEKNYVSSGKRYLNGDLDENFDASCFDNVKVDSRGSTTNIESIEDVGFVFDGNILSLSDTNSERCTVNVTSIDGKNIETKILIGNKSSVDIIDFSTYTSGVYIVHIKTKERMFSRKIVVL